LIRNVLTFYVGTLGTNLQYGSPSQTCNFRICLIFFRSFRASYTAKPIPCKLSRSYRSRRSRSKTLTGEELWKFTR